MRFLAYLIKFVLFLKSEHSTKPNTIDNKVHQTQKHYKGTNCYAQKKPEKVAENMKNWKIKKIRRNSPSCPVFLLHHERLSPFAASGLGELERWIVYPILDCISHPVRGHGFWRIPDGEFESMK
ncbi:hypothetical protein [Methanosarcina siciliae]|uniref:hypothetical protein n=1 Tax=Methanosarcina siciliae TaxID=38027 RepID=UPI00064F0B31|nr:hypothetical protein [Methanosarcina siciliae]